MTKKKKKKNRNLVVPRGSDQKVGFGTETEAGNGIGWRLNDLLKFKLR